MTHKPAVRRLWTSLWWLAAVLLFVAALGGPALAAPADNYDAATEEELAKAINEINALGSGSHSITLQNDITLTGQLPDLNNPALEEIAIEGNGTILTGDGKHSVFVIRAGTTVTINELDITGGASSEGFNDGGDGGIYNEGTLTLKGSYVYKNSAIDGAGVYNAGLPGLTAKRTLISSEVYGNAADGIGGVGVQANGGTADLASTTSRPARLAVARRLRSTSAARPGRNRRTASAISAPMSGPAKTSRRRMN